MIRSGYLSIALIIGFCLLGGATYAQDSGGQDSVAGGPERPRRDTYIIETFPSPALRTQKINIAYYNHNPEETMLRIVDINDKTVEELQPRKFVENGLHKFIPTKKLTSGVYFVRLTTFTATGSEKQVQDSRFIVIH